MPTACNGSDVVYNRIIRPFFLKHQTDIDATMNKMGDKIGKFADGATKGATDAFTKSE